jgi:putative addiction module component (TIGR02574 family)
MKATLETVAKTALSLPADDRARLAERIVQSLVAHTPVAVKRKQLAEVMRRREAVLTGKVKGVSLAQAIQEIQALLA